MKLQRSINYVTAWKSSSWCHLTNNKVPIAAWDSQSAKKRHIISRYIPILHSNMHKITMVKEQRRRTKNLTNSTTNCNCYLKIWEKIFIPQSFCTERKKRPSVQGINILLDGFSCFNPASCLNTSIPTAKSTKLIMVVIVVFITEYSTVENIGILNHLSQRKAPVFICISLRYQKN